MAENYRLFVDKEGSLIGKPKTTAEKAVIEKTRSARKRAAEQKKAGANGNK